MNFFRKFRNLLKLQHFVNLQNILKKRVMKLFDPRPKNVEILARENFPKIKLREFVNF